MFGLGVPELVIVGIVALLLFGKRLPEVARSLGGSYREFRKGLTESSSAVDVNDTSNYSSASGSYASAHDDYDDYEEATAPKFDPPPSEPAESTDSTEEKAV